jgi:hypothetical protein
MLTADEAEEIAAAFPAIRGERYAEGAMRSVNPATVPLDHANWKLNAGNPAGIRV